MLHPNSIAQHSLPMILKETGPEFTEELHVKLKASAEIAYERLQAIKGLHPLKATAGFFMMVELDMT